MRVQSLLVNINQTCPSIVRFLQNSIRTIALIAGTIICAACVGAYPNTSGIALLIGFMGGRTIHQLLQDHFLNDLSNHFFSVTIITGIVFFSIPTVIKGALAIGFCAWAGSRFKLYLNNEH